MEEMVGFLLLGKDIKSLINLEVWWLSTFGAFPRDFQVDVVAILLNSLSAKAKFY